MVDRVHIIPLLGTMPRLTVLPREPVLWPPPHEAAWGRMLDANERLHDGPIWSVVRADRGVIEVRPDQYKRLAVQRDPAVGDLGVRQLSVKGLTVGVGRDGESRLLLARRGVQTRMYAGQWETAPAGGVDPRGRLTPETLIEAVVREAHEELGIDIGPFKAQASPVCLLADGQAHSLDVVFQLPWPTHVNERAGVCTPGNWEYLDAAWLTRDECAGFVRQSAAAVSPPTLAVLRWIGWAPA